MPEILLKMVTILQFNLIIQSKQSDLFIICLWKHLLQKCGEQSGEKLSISTNNIRKNSHVENVFNKQFYNNARISLCKRKLVNSNHCVG